MNKYKNILSPLHHAANKQKLATSENIVLLTPGLYRVCACMHTFQCTTEDYHKSFVAQL